VKDQLTRLYKRTDANLMWHNFIFFFRQPTAGAT